jgi:cell shape-determining protein MreC
MRFRDLLTGNGREVPFRSLAAVLFIAFLVCCLPARMSVALKDAVRSLLAPGQCVAQTAVARLRFWGRAWQQSATTASELDELRQLARRLEHENAALRFAVQHQGRAANEPLVPLITARAVASRVLGQHAQKFLYDSAVIDAPAAADLTEGSLALDLAPTAIDQGQNASLTVGDLALVGGSVWGKLIEVGPQTSLVRRVSSSGYRGLVQIAQATVDGWKPLARGIVEGTGDTLCRIRLVDATAPVSVGDMVFAADEQGLVDAALIYGQVARAELPTGAAHWQIWMEPAADIDLPGTLTVLQPVINQDRGVAKSPFAPRNDVLSRCERRR